MSDRLLPITPKKALTKLKRAGFLEHRQRGSHMVLKHPDGRRVVLPMHSGELPRGTLQAIAIHQAQLSAEEWNYL